MFIQRLWAGVDIFKRPRVRLARKKNKKEAGGARILLIRETPANAAREPAMSQAGNAGDESERKVSLSLSGLYIGFFLGGIYVRRFSPARRA